ncbi:MAG: gluconokinase [Acidobacteriaceae bacterium]
MILVLMGVSGSGKTTIGTMLASRLECTFADADDYHPEANRQKMHAGIPLNDEDRAPWLATLNQLMVGWEREGKGGILACSALKEKYRHMLMANLPEGSVRFVLLDGSRDLIAERLQSRQHEFMSPKLLDSQFATLEPPQNALRVSIDQPETSVVNEILSKL